MTNIGRGFPSTVYRVWRYFWDASCTRFVSRLRMIELRWRKWTHLIWPAPARYDWCRSSLRLLFAIVVTGGAIHDVEQATRLPDVVIHEAGRPVLNLPPLADLDDLDA